MNPHRASNMGGGGGSYAPYGDSPYGPTAPKHSARRGGQRNSLGPQVPETMDRAFGNYYLVHVDAHQKHRRDLATLRKEHAALKAQLQARALEGRPVDETDGAIARACAFLPEIERDIVRLEEGERRDVGGRVRDDGRGGEERTGGMGSRQKKSHAGGSTGRDARGYGRFSEFRKRSSNPAAAVRQVGRHRDGLGHAGRRGMTEDNITRDFSRLGVEPRGHSKTPRPPPRHYDFEDYADEVPHEHRGSSEPSKRSSSNQAAARPAGKRHLDGSGHASRRGMTEEDDIAATTRDFSRLGVRSREHGKTPRLPRHHDIEDPHADEASDYLQPRESLISSRRQPSTGHARSSDRHLAHESRAPSRRQNAEDYATGASNHQPRGSLSGHHHHQPSTGHGRSSSGRFADHETAAPSSRHQNAEDYAAGEPDYHQPRESPISSRRQPSTGHARSSDRHLGHEMAAPSSRHQNAEDYATGGEPDYHQPRSSRHGRHLPPATGHARSSSSGHGFAATLYSSR